MTRRMLASAALALGAALAMGGSANAAEPDKTGGFTMTLGGKGTVAQAATATDDVEEARYYHGGYRGYYGGYRGFYGGYRGFYGYGGYRGWGYGGWGGYGFYRPYYFRPAFYASYYYPYTYSTPYLYGGLGFSNYGGFGGGFCLGINGTANDASAPAMTLNLAVAKNPVLPMPTRMEAPADDTFRYDGGPANPVPQPKPDMNPQSTTAPAAPGLPVSLKKPASPYTYKAYGEK